jgi:ankyrin repeat protein
VRPWRFAWFIASYCICAASSTTAELVLAAKTGDNRWIQSVLAAGAKINAKDKGGMTPLLAAVTNNQASTVKLLLNKGAAADARGDRKATPCSLPPAMATTQRQWLSLLLGRP